METLTTSLVTLLGVFSCGIVGYVIKLSGSMRQIEKQARAGEYDARNVRKLLQGIGMVKLASAGVCLVLLVLMLLSKLPAIGFLVAGIFFSIRFCGDNTYGLEQTAFRWSTIEEALAG